MTERAYDFRVSTEPRLGTEVVYATHNFSDRTTWFGQSERVTNEAAADAGIGLVWNLAHAIVIDLTHGKMFDEAQYVADQKAANPGDPHGYSVVVRVDGIEKVARAPFATSGGDYTVDYALGKITFFVSQLGNDVRVDYSYANGSVFAIVPDAGFNLDIESVKASWSDDFVMVSAVLFEVWGLAEIFAPQLGLPAGTKIPLDSTRYETMNQFVGEAVAYEEIPASGGAARGLLVARHAIIFRYATVRRLMSAYGVELRVSLGGDIPMQGGHSGATFYCTRRAAGVV